MSIPLFACDWNQKFNLEDENYKMFYYSLCLNDIPVYKVKFKKENQYFVIYKYNNIWKIAENFTTFNNYFDFSFHNSLHNYIPPIEGWKENKFKVMFHKMINKYHNQLSNYDNDFKYFHIKYSKYLNNKGREYIINFILINKKIPIEMILMILSFFRIKELNN